MPSQSLRFKLYSLLSVPIVALIGLWTFVAGHVLGDFFELSTATAVFEEIGDPAGGLVTSLQQERRDSAIFLSSGQPDALRLANARRATDQAVEQFRHTAIGERASTVTTREMRVAIDAVIDRTQGLSKLREKVDGKQSDRLETVQAYGAITDTVFRLYDQLITVPRVQLYQQAIALQRIAHARDLISREDALVSGAVLSGKLDHEEYEAIEVLSPNRQLLLSEGVAMLDTELRTPFERLIDGADNTRLGALEREIIEGARLPRDAAAWQEAVTRIGPTLDQLLESRIQLLTGRSDDTAGGIIARIVIVGGLGIAAILVAVIWSVRLGRGLVEELDGLRGAATDVAEVRLPQLVERLRSGQTAEADTSSPIAVTTPTQEMRDLANAFESVRRTAVRAAIGQAELRQGLNRVFRNLARRNQSLVHRQLGQLDAMQRKTAEPDQLSDLFRLDHLTTRMRRQAEGLVILSGAPAGRQWRRPVQMLDVVRGAVAEVEDYLRVNVQPMPDATLTGAAAADVIHLLAELVENATVFSPPNTQVNVSGELVARGFAVEIEDRGLGMSDTERDELNRRLADPPEFDLADSDRLGLFVVGRLAVRHGIKVTLQRSAYGGTTAIVLIPISLMTDPTGDLAHTHTD
ncbi:nitrate- and nitrite sensing domain-containing protein [Nonomuraea sp. NPDC049152]|uniref:sensor histidine kinase n=1 Tax=Nonomuraea sp. NPDC049152 TaxID=3154350 RepID=UPI0033E14E54